jgi:hypothetical protein
MDEYYIPTKEELHIGVECEISYAMYCGTKALGCFPEKEKEDGMTFEEYLKWEKNGCWDKVTLTEEDLNPEHLQWKLDTGQIRMKKKPIGIANEK